MQDFLLTTPAQAVIWTTALVIICLIAYYVVERFRDRKDDNHSVTHELLTNFRDLRQQGVIEETEFRDIKTVLGTKLRHELKNSAAAEGPASEESVSEPPPKLSGPNS